MAQYAAALVPIVTFFMAADHRRGRLRHRLERHQPGPDLAVRLVLGRHRARLLLFGPVPRAFNPPRLIAGWLTRPRRSRDPDAVRPIAVGYTVAHCFSLVVFTGQAGYLLASDPFGRGWDLFGTAGSRINYRVVTTGMIALVQVRAILTGHVVGVFIAHDRPGKQRHELGRPRGTGGARSCSSRFLPRRLVLLGVPAPQDPPETPGQDQRHPDDGRLVHATVVRQHPEYVHGRLP
jgi:hypothetical protein